MMEKDVSLYERNLKTIESRCPELYREYMTEIARGEDCDDDETRVEALVGRLGHPTFRMQARERRKFGESPFEFVAKYYMKACRSAADSLTNGCENFALKRADDSCLLPKYGVVTDEIRTVTGHSMFDPEREAEKRFRNEILSENDRVVLLGMGFGYELREILKLSKHNVVIVIEPYVAVFKAALENVDLTDIFESGRAIVTFSLDPGALQYHLMAGMSHLSIPNFLLRTLPHVSLCPQLFKSVSAARREATTFMLFNLMTGIVAGPKLQMNTVLNAWAAMKSPGVEALKDSFKERAAIVVAPGPSLEGNIKELKRAKGKALIIACDTSTRILLRHGVEPDVIVTIDYQPLNFFKLRGVDTSFAYLFPSLEVTPHAPLNHRWRMFTYYHNDISERLFEDILGRKGLIRTGGSVLTDAFSIARHMGANPIILAGVDLGFPGMRWYADGSFDDGRFTDNLKSKKVDTIEIEDIYGNPMVTYKSFYEFLKWFRKNVKAATGVTVVDATEGGAKIDGTRIMKMSDAIDEYVDDEKPPMTVLDEYYESYSPPPATETLGKIHSLIKDYTDIVKEIKDGINSCKRAREALKKGGELRGDSKLIKALKKINGTKAVFVQPEYENRLSFVAIMMERQMADITFYVENSKMDMRERIEKLVELDENFYIKAEKACENMITHLEYIRDEIKAEEDYAQYV